MRHYLVSFRILLAFYSEYTGEVQKIIEANAKREFECLWKAVQTGQVSTYTLASDLLSQKIIEMTLSISRSNLFDNEKVREKVLKSAIPVPLIRLVGEKKVVERLPKNYVLALFASTLASRFIYDSGIKPDPFAFYQFIQDYTAQ